jgi:hypothetical protein
LISVDWHFAFLVTTFTADGIDYRSWKNFAIKIKTFVGTSANAVRIQVWTAL